MKFGLEVGQLALRQSPPSRGAWIEIPAECCFAYPRNVAPLAGGVD